MHENQYIYIYIHYLLYSVECKQLILSKLINNCIVLSFFYLEFIKYNIQNLILNVEIINNIIKNIPNNTYFSKIFLNHYLIFGYKYLF